MPRSNGQTLTEEPALDRRLAELRDEPVPAPPPITRTLMHLAELYERALRIERDARERLTAATAARQELERAFARQLADHAGSVVITSDTAYWTEDSYGVLKKPLVWAHQTVSPMPVFDRGNPYQGD